MKLVEFRVKNYRSIYDSGVITTEGLTAILGRNESGKSNLLRALQALNPASGRVEIDSVKNFPRNMRLTELNKEEVFLNTKWALSEEEKEKLYEIFPRAQGVENVTFKRPYSNKLYLVWEGLAEKTFDAINIKVNLDRMCNIIDSIEDPESIDVRNKISQSFRSLKPSKDMTPDKWLSIYNESYDKIFQQCTPLLGDLATTFYELGEIIQDIATSIDDKEKQDSARDWITNLLPLFVYIDEYPHINGKQSLDSFIRNKNSNSLSEADEGFDKLLRVAGLNVEELCETPSDSDKRNLLVNRASAVVTQEIRRLWSDRELKIRFNLDGDSFDTYISDPSNTYDVDVNLGDRSRGFQWFFSFYIAFSADTKGGDSENAILLLDEPGLYLHAKSQGDLLTHFKDDYANQIIFTTHSPFMVPTDRLEAVKTVNICQEKGTTVTNDPTGDASTLFPLQAALGYEVAQSLFIGAKNLVLEGITDFWYLSSVSEHLISLGRTGLSEKITLTPAGGAQKIPYMVSLLSANNTKLVVLLDHEREAIETQKHLVNTFGLAKNNILLVSDALDDEDINEADIEDLLGEELFLKLATRAYSEDLDGNLTFNDNVPRVCKKFEQALKKHSNVKKFVKAKPAKLFMTELSSNSIELNDYALDNFERLFAMINRKLK